MSSIPAPSNTISPNAPAGTGIDLTSRSDEVLRWLSEAREKSSVLEKAQVELIFPGPREARSAAPRRSKTTKRVSLRFMGRTTPQNKRAKCSLLLEMAPFGASDKSALKLRVELNPQRAKQDPSQISVGIGIYVQASDAPDADEQQLTRSPVGVGFDWSMSGGVDAGSADDSEPVELSSIQSLGPMLTELQRAWFQNRKRAVGPQNVAFHNGVDLIDFWVSSNTDETWLTWQPEPTPQTESLDEAGSFLAALVAWRCLAALYTGDDSRKELRQRAGLPEPEEFLPKRPVDLNPSDVRTHLAQRKLRVPWHVIEAACTSLNAGKHVIFTGPPGCGKTELAAELALLATRRERDGLLCTASPAWSASELIGRYLPRTSQYGLDFAPGFFLRAIRDRRWLIIDEFNRAPIDACFGELFTVLAGQPAELPFDEHQPSGTSARVRVLPAMRESAARAAEDEARKYADYVVPAEFRIIGTMNDADRSELSRLSFALLRRFDIIRVDAPDSKELELVIEDAMQSAKLLAELPDRGYIFKGTRGGAVQIFDSLRELLHQIFIGTEETDGQSAPPQGLVSQRIVGVATCRDVIAFVAEGLRAPAPQGPADDVSKKCFFKRDEEQESRYHPRYLARSYLAMALVLKVFPQLDSLDPERRHSVVRYLLDLFERSTFLRTSPVADASNQGHSFEIVAVSAPKDADLDHNDELSIPEYLLNETLSLLRGTDEGERYEDLRKRLSENDNGMRNAAA